MSKTHRDLAKMERAASEVDGEFCIPQEEGEVRHHIDLGPILAPSSAPAISSSARPCCSCPRCSCSSWRSS
jgi:hypothetical protein